MNHNFSSYIITETNLGAQCAEILLSAGHEILGIISDNPDVIKWCLTHQIPYFLNIKKFEEIKPFQTFDYFFSIINGQILSPTLLGYPRCYAINYHDAPLSILPPINRTTS